MTNNEYIKSCIFDALSALDVKDLPMRMPVNNDWIYPSIARERIESMQRKLKELKII